VAAISSVIVATVMPVRKELVVFRWSFTYCRVRARASTEGTEHALEGHNVLCPHQPLAQGRKALQIKDTGDRRVARKGDNYAFLGDTPCEPRPGY
jgi:hypothetical protein